MASKSFQIPFFVRESMVVAQAVAMHVTGAKFTFPPMTVKATSKATVSSEEMVLKEKYAEASVYFHFGGGVAVTVEMFSSYSEYGEHWGVTSVKARWYDEESSRQRVKTKAEKIWTGEEFDELAAIWGNSPSRWVD